jgi:predicted ATPase/5S rRNA maturation endonuclease (ribonuclease M5)
LDIEKHIIDRAKSSSDVDKQNLEALVQKVENHLNKTILSGWQEILSADLGGKRFRFFIRQNDEGIVYAEIKLFDGNSLFALKERSAGFRWFFSFIMLVTNRVHRNDRVLFLFDEPAANLHPRAQAKLLKSFATLSKSHQFLFTTHSHYLVNPLWLESTFVVKNEALIESSDFIDINHAIASITVTPYRTFVGSHLNQHFYYRPVMDALDYCPPSIGPETTSILIEGKTDFYCIEYFKTVYFANSFQLNLFPGGGSGALDSLISLLLGWGSKFIVLLDGDESGNREKSRYEEKFESLVSNRIITLNSVLNTKEKVRIEEVFSEEDTELIRLQIFPSEPKLTKRLLHKAIQELLASGRRLEFSETTINNFRALLSGLEQKYEAL